MTRISAAEFQAMNAKKGKSAKVISIAPVVNKDETQAIQATVLLLRIHWSQFREYASIEGFNKLLKENDIPLQLVKK